MRRTALLLSLSCLAYACSETETGGTTVTVEDSGADVALDMAQESDARPTPDAALRPMDARLDAAADAGDAMLADAAPDMLILTACADSIDNDNDGLIDYPLDRGCTSSADDNELDPDEWECSDGVDNDLDGLSDHPNDPGCSTPDDVNESNICDPVHSFTDLTGLVRAEGSTLGAMGHRNVCRNNNAPEAVFLFTLRESIRRLRVDTRGSSYDTLLGVWKVCDDPSSEIACNDDISFRERTSEVVIEAPPPADYFILVDGHGEEAGPFVVNIQGEQNIGEPCPESGWITCGVGGTCREGVCQRAACADNVDNDGDGVVDYPNDAGCDDASDDDETTPIPRPLCGDGIDNDFDGRTDYPEDPDCYAASDNDESSPPACQDGVDNDQDGLIDLDDPGCDGDPNRASEFNTAACRNGRDDDEDELIDFPADPGCSERDDTDETDPDELPACSDGLDNDEDGLTDYPEDIQSCLYAADPSEDDACDRVMPREITGLSRTRGSTQDEPNDFAGTCHRPSSSEDVLLWRVAEDRPLQNLIIDTRDSAFDTVLHVRTACAADTEIACDDNGGSGFTSRVELGPQEPGAELLIFVDGKIGQQGIWRMRISAELAADANCGGRGDYVCGEGLTCEETADGSRCVRAPCGDEIDNDEDGLVDYPNDPGCVDGSDQDETDPPIPPMCSNGIDDDGDGHIDFGTDPGCQSAADDFEGADCADGIDNDQDGSIDYDRDGNGSAGPNRDPECVCAQDPLEDEQPDCRDLCDNDRDGLIDLEDPGCRDDPERNTEFNTPQCRDRIDNNADGRIDYPEDPSCTFGDSPLERDLESPPACSDGLDNDEDGATDYPNDDGCIAAADPNEQSTCESDLPLYPSSGIARGSTINGLAEHQSTCGFDGGSPEIIFRVAAPYPGQVIVNSQGSSFNTILYARSTCTPETVCPEPEPEPQPDAGVQDAAVAADAGIEDAAISADAAVDGAAPAEDAAAPVDAGPADAAPPLVDAAPPLVDAAADAAVVVDAAPETDGSAVADAGLGADASPEGDGGQGNAGNNDPGDEPCFPEISQVGCNDNAFGFLSRMDFPWLGGDFFLFVDGFGRAFGDFRTELEIVYPRNGQCGPILIDYARCAVGTECRLDVGLGIPICQ